ncbi:sn-glycerol 3-phosphate transport system ATP-binding protein OS=Castellaniella defragrans OX=75697 GN=HNR28_002827 PE=4 SV=1 [Castellaniella defragrans]
MAQITISDLVKRYGKTQIVHGISIDITDGEFVVLVGPSGCGKSTLVRMLAGLEDVTGGSIKIDGREVNDVEPKDRDIAMVFQSYALYPNMTVAENMGFSLRLRRADPKVMAERVADAARILDLDPYLERYPRELSGGQRQRVAMGRAMVRDPKVFLFDEPLSNLDAKLRVAMRAEIKALHQRLKTTTVYVTHDQVEAMTMADRIVVMREGRVEQVGTPLELYDHPDNLFVAQFIGSPAMNVVRGTLHRTQDAIHVESADGVRWPVSACIEGLEGQAVQYGIRPEHIRIGHDLDAGSGGLVGTVVVTEPMGAETELQLAVGDGKIKVKAQGRVLVGPGEVVRFGVMPDMVHLFDAETGERLSTRVHVLH